MNASTPLLLIIDDDPVLRLMMGEVLREAGLRIIEADSAEAGLRCFDEASVDLVLLDVMLPGMSGFQACARIRARPRGETVPIIVMTGRDDRDAIVDAFESGATDFLTKPVNWGLLPHRVRYALRSSRLLAEATRSRALLARSQRLANMGSWEWTRADDVLELSDELQRIHGGRRSTDEHGFDCLQASVHEDDRERVEAALAQARDRAESYAIEFRLHRDDGGLRRVFEQTDVECDEAGSVLAIRGIRLDITEQVEADQRIRVLANTDALTGLPNRSLFRQLAAARLAMVDGEHCAVLFVALPDFAAINQRLGPAVADQVLKVVGERLRSCMGGEHGGALDPNRNLLARFGGGEFLLLLTDIDDALVALRTAEWLVRELQRPITLQPHPLDVAVRIGIAVAPQDGNDVDNLLNHAGTAAHAAKEAGGSPIRLYNEAMSAELRRRLAIQSELRVALDNDQLRLHYQPKIDTRSERVCGAEALLRWQHPRDGLLGPDAFIDIAEESGLIVDITEWVVSEVVRQQSTWRDAGLTLVPVSVNLAAASLRSDDIVDWVAHVLRQHELSARWLDIEVTESSMMHDMDRACRVLDGLKALGTRLSIDDFGVGYSALSYLQRFPIDVLKIDRSFVSELAVGNSNARLAAAIIAMGLSLDLELVAEGVETPEQAAFLASRGCHVVQGYLYGRAVEAAQFELRLREVA